MTKFVRYTIITLLIAIAAFMGILYWEEIPGWIRHTIIGIGVLTTLFGATLATLRLFGKKFSLKKGWEATVGFVKKVKNYIITGEPVGMGPVGAFFWTSFFGIMTGVLPGYIVAELASWAKLIPENGVVGSILYWTILFVISIGIALILIEDKRTNGPFQKVVTINGKTINKEGSSMLPVPINNAAVLTLFKSRLHWIYLKEGASWVPWWLGVSVSKAEVSQTKVQLHNEKGQPLPEENRGYFRHSEALGYVFIGKRTIQEVVVVQSDDLIRVTADANSVIRVVNPIKWQAADNPYGTMIGRLEGSLRMAIAAFHAEDANVVRSLFPSLILGDWLLYLKVQGQKEGSPYLKGDLVCDPSGRRLVKKLTQKEMDEPGTKNKALEDYIKWVNENADDACKLENSKFTVDMLDPLEVSKEYLAELKAYGAKKESMVIKDISLPVEIEQAAARSAIERQEQVAELVQAETNYLVTEKHAKALKDFGPEAVTMAMIDREKGSLSVGMGSNPIAQLFGFINKGGS